MARDHLRILSLILLGVSVFVTADLGLNLLHAFIPELNDGIGSFSILQGLFGILGNSGWSVPYFFTLFTRALWVTVGLAAWNILLACAALIRKR